MAIVRLSVLADDLAGKAGNVVFVRTRYGPSVRPRLNGIDPATPPQIAMREMVRVAARAWHALTPEQVLQWKNYASTLPGNPIAYMAFSGLSVKLLQVHGPNALLPSTPPKSPFVGDNIQLAAEARNPGFIRFSPSGRNSDGLTTELLVQALPARHRTPFPEKLRTQAFHAFTRSEPLDLPLPPGFYAPGYRFVDVNTGQVAPLVLLATVFLDGP